MDTCHQCQVLEMLWKLKKTLEENFQLIHYQLDGLAFLGSSALNLIFFDNFT